MVVEKNIPEGWIETTLGEVATFQRGFDLPKSDRTFGEYPLMVSNGQDGTHKEFKVSGPGIVTGRSGSLGNVFYIKDDFWPLNTTLWIKNFHKNDIRFVYYFLIKFPFEKYNAGSGVPTLNRNHIHPLPVIIPPLPEQKAIANVLTAFDDKIELLQAQNKTLETMAQTIFKEWFGKYQIGDELPEGWTQHNFIDLVKHIKPGTNYQPKRVENGIPFINGRHVKNGVIHFRDIKYITEEEYARVHKSWKPEKNDILITRIGTLGNVGIIQKTDLPLALHYNSINIKEDKLTHQFLYFLLKSEYFQEQFHLNKKQSVQEFVTIEAVEQIRISIPSSEILEEKTKCFENILLKILNNNSQIQSLTKTRDTLLPKLMSGQVRVKNIKQTADA